MNHLFRHPNMGRPNIGRLFLLFSIVIALPELRADHQTIRVTRQVRTSQSNQRFHRLDVTEKWDSQRTALIICDVWDSHHCVQAVRRVLEVAPRINRVANTLRSRGATIIHAPSDCMPAYVNHPARRRALDVTEAMNLPTDIATWCDQIGSEKGAPYPVDQSDGGEDDDPAEHRSWSEQLEASHRNPKTPWMAQSPLIDIDGDRDYITDSGNHVWNILEAQGIENVVVCGVHTNMCVLGRPFGLRQLAQHGTYVILMRDLTDTMYNPARWPYVDHFSGTDLVIDHVERYVCPTTTSDQFLGDGPFRFSADRRRHLAILVAEDEYKTEETLPPFAMTHLSKDLRVSFVHSDSVNLKRLPGLEEIESADALLVSVRRRPLASEQLNWIRAFVASGKPVIGIRTASHAFCLRDGGLVEGTSQWPEFDAQVFGGNYSNHYGNELHPIISFPPEGDSPLSRLQSTTKPFHSRGSLYRVTPLASNATVVAQGQVDGSEPEPVAWTYVRSDSGRSFYTSLGHPDDFAEPAFRTLLVNGIHWALDMPLIDEATAMSQWDAHRSGAGKQR